jgi:Arm DNA-binding domain
MPKLLLTQHQVNIATCSSGKVKLDLFDSNCKGLMLEIRASGGKTYYLRYFDNRGKTRQLKLADERDVTLAQAKLLADKMRNKIALGIDPVENKKSIKLIPTFGDFIKDSYMPYVKGYKKSWKIDPRLFWEKQCAS